MCDWLWKFELSLYDQSAKKSKPQRRNDKDKDIKRAVETKSLRQYKSLYEEDNIDLD